MEKTYIFSLSFTVIGTILLFGLLSILVLLWVHVYREVSLLPPNKKPDNKIIGKSRRSLDNTNGRLITFHNPSRKRLPVRRLKDASNNTTGTLGNAPLTRTPRAIPQYNQNYQRIRKRTRRDTTYEIPKGLGWSDSMQRHLRPYRRRITPSTFWTL